MSRRNLLLTLSIVVLLVVASLFLFPSFRHFLSSRVLPIPPITETMVGGRLLATPAPGPHTLTYEARTSSGVTLTDSVTFTQPAPVCNNNIVEPGEACDAPDLTQPLGATNPGLLQDYCSQRCQVELDVTEYGATANTSPEPQFFSEGDTNEIQIAINTAFGTTASANVPAAPPVKTPPTFNPPDTIVSTVYFPPGRYDISQVHVWWRTTLVGAGKDTIIKRLPDRDGERMFNTGNLRVIDGIPFYNVYSVPADSAPLVIKNMSIDGNGLNQSGKIGAETIPGVPSTEYEDIIFIVASGGAYPVTLEDLYFTEAGAAAVNIFRYANVTARNIECFNTYVCFYVDGDPNTVLAEHFKLENELTWPPAEDTVNGRAGGAFTGFWEEARYGSPAHVTLKDWTLINKSLSAQLLTGSTLTIEDFHQDSPYMYLYVNPGTSLKVKNSSFIYGPNTFNPQAQSLTYTVLKNSGNVEFKDTTFTATEKWMASEANRPINGFNLAWSAVDHISNNGTFKCSGCIFDADSTVEAADTVKGILTGVDRLSQNNTLILEGGSFSNIYDEAVRMDRGGTWLTKGVNFLSNLALSVYYVVAENRYYDVTIEGGTPYPPPVCQHIPNSTACSAEAVPPNILTRYPMVSPAVCGNGTREDRETCDDGDEVSGDGCSSICRIEPGYQCDTATPNVCTKP